MDQSEQQPLPTLGGDAADPAHDEHVVHSAVVAADADPAVQAAVDTLLDRDGATGLIDVDAVLGVITAALREVYSQAKTDRAHTHRAQLLDQVAATEAVTNAVSAVQLVRLAQFAATGVERACDVDPGSDSPELVEVVRPIGHVEEFCDTEVAALLTLSPLAGTYRTEEAADACRKVPLLVDEVAAGRLDRRRLATITAELVEAGEDTCGRVQRSLLERGVGSWTNGRVANQTRRMIQAVDPAAAHQAKRRQAAASIGVFTQPGALPGLTQFSGVMDTGDASSVFEAIEALAQGLHRANGDKSIGQCRADAMRDLILQNANITTTLNFMIPINTHPTAAEAAAATTAASAGTARAAAEAERPAADHDSAPANGEQDLSGHVPLTDAQWDEIQDEDGWDAGCAVDVGAVDVGAVDWDAVDWDAVDWDAEMDRLLAEQPPPAPPADPDGYWNAIGEDADADAGLFAEDHVCRPPIGGWGIGPVEIPRLGVISPQVIAALTRQLGSKITRVLIDQDTGVVIESATKTYRPTAGIKRMVTQRDQTCRFPTCAQAGKYTEADHVIPWPQGPTAVQNLQLLCKHHHRAKHEGGWSVAMTPQGICTWTSPTGRQYPTYPAGYTATASKDQQPTQRRQITRHTS